MTKAEFFHRLDALFDLSPGTVDQSSVLDEVGDWDSLTQVEFIAVIDETFNRTVPPEALARCQTAADLMKFVPELES